MASRRFRMMLTVSITAASLGFSLTPAIADEAVTVATAPSVGFDSGVERDAPFTAVPHDVVLGVGATQSELIFNWITAQGLTGQVAQISLDDTFASPITVDAVSENVSIVNTEGDSRDRAEGEYVEYRDGAVNRATVDSLAENTTYSYRVGSEADGWSEVQTFNTGTYGDNWNFLFFGDTQLYNTHSNRAEEVQNWANNLERATTEKPRNLLHPLRG